MIACCYCGKPSCSGSFCPACKSKLEQDMTIDLFYRICHGHFTDWPYFENFVLDVCFGEKQQFIRPTSPALSKMLKHALEYYETAIGTECLQKQMFQYILDENLVYTFLEGVKK